MPPPVTEEAKREGSDEESEDEEKEDASVNIYINYKVPMLLVNYSKTRNE